MSLHSFNTVSELVKYGNSLLDEVDVVSFDVFDTLLVRRIHDPDMVKPPVAKFVASLAARQGIRIDWEEIQECRDRHENAMRQKTAETFVDHEAHYGTFMRSMLEELFTSDIETLYQEVRAYELKIENGVLVPRAGIADWVRELHTRGKRLFAVTDIYLSATEVTELLEHAGLLEYLETVVSSADSYLCKASGKAFEMLTEKYALQTSRWIHIGDNPISDGIRPVEAGLHGALVLQDTEERRRKSIARHYYHYSLFRKFWSGRTLQQFMAPMEAENQPCSGKYLAGYNFFGPLMGVYIQSIAEHCKQRGISKIFFLSREGWLFKQVWEKVTPYLYPGENLPEIEYLYVSRMALAGTSCAYSGLSRNNADIVFLPAGNRDFTDVCRVFGLQIDAFTELLQRYELSADTVLSHNHEGFKREHRKNFYRLLEDSEFQLEIKRQTRPGNDALQRYLEASGFFDHHDVALVDIGWLGTIQRYLYAAVAHRDDRPHCHGLLFGATRGIPFDEQDRSQIKGLIYDPMGGDFPGNTILYAQDLFEEACRAPHPTLNGYRLKGKDGYELVFREMSDATGLAEQEQDQHYADLQRGILDAADRFGTAAAIMMADSSEYRAWINYLLVNKLAFPKRTEIEEMHFKHHLDDFHGSSQAKQQRRKIRIFENPWTLEGWQLRLSGLFRGLRFRRHIRAMVNRAAINER